MSTLAQTTNTVFAAATLGGDVLAIALAAALAVPWLRRQPAAGRTLHWLGRYALAVGLLLALLGTAGSLWYSNVIGYPPCDLCWVQRIALYPQVLLLAVALFKRDRGAVDYALVLSLAGLAVAAYHVSLQFGLAPLAPCSVGAVSCSQRPFLAYGYVTIPVMSLTAFALQALVMATAKVAGRVSQQG